MNAPFMYSTFGGFDSDDYPAVDVYGLEPSPEYELARQARIAAGHEYACAGCGCSETCACSGGCIWVTPTLCSRCARKGIS